jgi:flagellar hook-associated protein 1
MSSLSIGLSGLTVSQQLLNLTGQNITNANTPGYHLQVAQLSASTDGSAVGTGVDLTGINRIIDSVLEQALNANSSGSQNVSTQLNAMQQVQTMLSPGSGSLNDLLQSFFNQAEQLSSNPSDPTQREAFLSAATSLANGLNGLAGGLSSLQSGLIQQAQQTIASANGILPQIAQLNGEIQSATLAGNQPNDLMDQRDQLIANLASIVNVQTVDEGSGMTGVVAGGIPVVLGTQSFQLSMTNNAAQNSAKVMSSSSSTPLTVTNGQLAGFLDAANQSIPSYGQQLNALAQQLIVGVNEIQATSLSLNGPSTLVQGQNSVNNATVPLAQAGLALPLQAGTLYVSVTNNATGARTLTPVTINPATQSLQDVAAALSAVPNLNAVVNTQTNTLTVLANAGYSFDFAGRLPTSPQTSTITGTAVPQISGTYTGSTNDDYTFTVDGSGTVGVTPNLSLQETNASGAVLGTFNIGSGYAPGSQLQTANGVNVQLSAGTLNNGDSFSTATVANPDSGGLLAALGLNTFFQGSDAGSIGVNPDLVNNPDDLAVSKTGAPADGSALQQYAAFQNAPVLVNGTQSLEQFAGTIVGNIGSQVQNLTQQQTAQQAVATQLQNQQQSVSGVDTNAELVNLMQYQQSYQMAAHYLSVVDQAFTALIQIT